MKSHWNSTIVLLSGAMAADLFGALVRAAPTWPEASS